MCSQHLTASNYFVNWKWAWPKQPNFKFEVHFLNAAEKVLENMFVTNMEMRYLRKI